MNPRRFAVAGILVAIFLLFVLFFRMPGGRSDKKEVSSGGQEEGLELAREALSKGGDENTCQTAVQQANNYFASPRAPRLPGLTAGQRDLLAGEFGLDPSALAEVDGGQFARLDAHHLELCFLLRDAARFLSGETEKVPTPELAAAAFAWSARQVWLMERTSGPAPAEPPSTEFVLRRGRGSATERALVFLGLLDQLGVPGCLVSHPGEPRYWACGALLPRDGKPQIFLFDPRLGMPLPGPKGRGIATLAEAREDPDVLGQLNLNDEAKYDVTAEDARKAEVRLACPLSALAPRMAVLETLLRDPAMKAPAVHVRLSADPEDLLKRFREAAGKEKVGVARELVQVQRRFLPADQGGTDAKGEAFNRARLELVPWNNLPFDPRDKEFLPEQMSLRLSSFFAQPFVAFSLEPRGPRDLVLRGRLADAAPKMTESRDQLLHDAERLRAVPDWEKQLLEWREKARAALIDRLRAQDALERSGGRGRDAELALTAARAREEAVWKENERMLVTLLLGCAAAPRASQTDQQLALCMHERAGHFAPGAAGAKRAWEEAEKWWDTYVSGHSRAADVVPGRRLRAKALEALGERDRAARLLEDAAQQAKGPEKLACLFEAQQLRKKTGG